MTDAWNLSGRIAIAGIGETAVGKLPGRTPMDLAVEAGRLALADAGLETADVDGLVTCNAMAQTYMYPAEALAEYLGIQPAFCLGLHTGGATALSVLRHAGNAILSGACSTVLVTLGDSLRTGLTREAAKVMQSSASHPEFETPYGPTAPALYALAARAHMAAHGTRPEHLAAVAVSARAHAARHPHAEKREPITVDDVLASRMIADPLHLLDCSLVSDGGAAVVLTRAERARDLAAPPVYLLGIGEATRHEHISQAADITATAARDSGRRAFAMAGLAPADVNVAGIYDCFTPVVLMLLEDLGLCPAGGAGEFVAGGGTAPGGALPVNTHGGLLSHSHAGHPGSMFHLTEMVQQLRGAAGERQVAGARIALVHAMGGTLSSHATALLGREAP
ncbi:MAG: acetyl-CoA acetyltransferase [bacterium]